MANQHKDHHDENNAASWQELLTTRGTLLWSLRQNLVGKPLTVVDMAAQVPKPSRFHQWCCLVAPPSTEKVMIIACPKIFQQLEKEQDELLKEKGNGSSSFRHGLEKPDTRGKPPRPLNRCTHEEWTRQRGQVQRALLNLPERSLQACYNINMQEILRRHTLQDNTNNKENNIRMDWREVAVDAAVEWVTRLFLIRATFEDLRVVKDFWSVSRTLDTAMQHRTMEQKRRRLISVFQKTCDEGGESLIASFLTSGLSKVESFDNAVNALVAALDAVQALLFWTLWNLSKDEEGWSECQSFVMDRFSPDSGKTTFREAYQHDLDGLAQVKKGATQGVLVDFSNLSYLARALCESLRVFPPVWTLPRTWPQTSKLVPTRPDTYWSKLDIPCVNGVKSPTEWNPKNPQPTYIASFGLGRRHCPAGTAALHAVYYLLVQNLTIIESMEEEQQNHALESTYLLPTLSVVGCQMFHVTYLHDHCAR